VRLQLDRFDRETFNDSLTDINRYIQYMSTTIDDFRNFYKPDRQQERVSLADPMQSAINIINASLIANNIEITTDIRTKEPIRTYRNELTQVFLNILKNATDALIEHDTKSPKIAVSIFPSEDGGQSVTIRDNGAGIPETIIDKIFEPYFTTKDNYNGTGLGLYMSKTMIEEHCNGTISVRNTGEGAEFTMTLHDISAPATPEEE